jgi:HemK-like putative methylase
MKLVDLWKPHLDTPKGQRPRPTFKILDLCSGSGCISLALAKHLAPSPSSRPTDSPQVLGIDISPSALKLSNLNATQESLEHLVTYKELDITHPSAPHQLLELSDNTGFDLIVSNPPYIPPDEYETLDDSVKNWEDEKALLAFGEKGTAFYKRIAELLETDRFLKDKSPWLNDRAGRCELTKPPRVVLEMGGEEQVDIVKMMLEDTGKFEKVGVWKDMAGVSRCVAAY